MIRFRLILALVLSGFVLHRGYYTRKMRAQDEKVLEMPETGGEERLANLLAIPALVSTLIYLIFPNRLRLASLPFPDWLRWFGVAVALFGFALLQWSQIALGKNWSDSPLFLKDHALITNGPYRWIRHPIYTAFLLIFGSIFLISANWLVGGLWIGMVGFDILSRVRAEEEMLTRQFGDPYLEYMQTTGRFLPRLRETKVRTV